MKVSFKKTEKKLYTFPTVPTSQPSKPNVVCDLDAMLAQEIEDLNRDTEEDRRVKAAVIVAKPDPNKLADDDDSDDDSSSDTSGAGRIRFRLPKINRPPREEYYYYEEDDDDYEDDLAVRDPELFRTTELNRQIVLDDMPPPSPMDTQKSGKLQRRPPELVFSEPPETITASDRIVVSFTYGRCPEQPDRKSRKYLMACDFGEESMYAIHWAMGTMLRSGDEVHVVSVLNTEEDVDDMDEEEKYRLWQELDRNSKALISKVRTILGNMLLYNIKIAVYTTAGQTKECLLSLVNIGSYVIIYETPLTMVVCGSRDRGAFKGMLMGSVSTFLVNNSPVPVTVVRPQNKAKSNKKKLTAAQKLSQSVRSGQLKVDEVAGSTPSINSHDGI
ncbi:hypothetical protein EC973_007352 [Apophysomyces ossiformis]|uniref:UspA domain-containing protein n=1 Tax=Apophysomyces ossiformis TaxID=679940 RepID=A0A8H7BMD0_9FUNG|nr:hypothetical protein EC973_007352 [Apophysomyces ossiformis]